MKKIGFKAKITIDDNEPMDCNVLLMVAANGICYGGGYYGTPEAQVDDGFIDVCVVKKISRLKIANVIKYYKDGTHLNNPMFDDIIHFTRCKSVKIESNKAFPFCRDGEVKKVLSETVSILEKKLKLVLPKKAPLFQEERNEENEGVVCIG
jgi:diacylglycerol kinase family enzyme